MKFLLPVIVFSISLLTISFSTNRLKKRMMKEQGGFALIELFTSEGCSSCPPADEVLEEVQKEYSDKNVLVLSYHVDYWDKLGWKDIFSNASFTERQEYYSNIFHLNSIYTPQAVVNGKKEFIGSNKNKLISSIDEQLSEKPTTSIKLKAVVDTPGKIAVSYSVDGNNSKDAKLILLLVQKMATNKINRGENEGRTLHHVNIVREISSLSATAKERSITFDLPSELKKEDIFVAGFIQDNKSGKIKAIQSSSIE
jgi:hypothetical protein